MYFVSGTLLDRGTFGKLFDLDALGKRLDRQTSFCTEFGISGRPNNSSNDRWLLEI